MPNTKTFGQQLRVLLDESDLFSREEWAMLLGVEPSTLEGWVDDSSLPTTDELWVIGDAISEYDAVASAVAAMEELMVGEMDSVPHGKIPTFYGDPTKLAGAKTFREYADLSEFQ